MQPTLRVFVLLSSLLPGLLAAAGPPADEQRFDPPLAGAYLGIRIDDGPQGIVVASVERGTAAEAAGLRPGDVIVRFAGEDGLEKLGSGGFQRRVRALEAQKSVPMEILRRGEALRLEVAPDPELVRDACFLAARLRGHQPFNDLPHARPILDRLERDLPAAVRRSRTRHEAYTELNRLLDELDVSHTALIPPWTYECFLGSGQRAQDRYHLGFVLQQIETPGGPAYHVRDVMHGGPAERAGLLSGDELVAVNGIPVDRSPRRVLAGYEARRELYTLEVERDESVVVSFRRHEGEKPEALTLAADLPLSNVRAVQASVRLIDSPAGSLGYIHLWDLLSPRMTALLRDTLRGPFAPAAGVIVDLRGRGGQVPVLQAIAKLLREDGRPIALLIDSQTRSAKEVLAFVLKGAKGMTLVGERTAGAVRPGGYVKLPGGAQVMLPASGAVSDSVLQITKGVDLEGRGVEPDVPVTVELRFAAGRDAILERGIQCLIEALPRPKRLRL
jgi:C-terminal processing protease CtpA/Prc